ncbi:MAG: hypothetical protein ACK4NC_06875 [Candidatus Gracilibacteria bacterium]
MKIDNVLAMVYSGIFSEELKTLLKEDDYTNSSSKMKLFLLTAGKVEMLYPKNDDEISLLRELEDTMTPQMEEYVIENEEVFEFIDKAFKTPESFLRKLELSVQVDEREERVQEEVESISPKTILNNYRADAKQTWETLADILGVKADYLKKMGHSRPLGMPMIAKIYYLTGNKVFAPPETPSLTTKKVYEEAKRIVETNASLHNFPLASAEEKNAGTTDSDNTGEVSGDAEAEEQDFTLAEDLVEDSSTLSQKDVVEENIPVKSHENILESSEQIANNEEKSSEEMHNAEEQDPLDKDLVNIKNAFDEIGLSPNEVPSVIRMMYFAGLLEGKVHSSEGVRFSVTSAGFKPLDLPQFKTEEILDTINLIRELRSRLYKASQSELPKKDVVYDQLEKELNSLFDAYLAFGKRNPFAAAKDIELKKKMRM